MNKTLPALAVSLVMLSAAACKPPPPVSTPAPTTQPAPGPSMPAQSSTLVLAKDVNDILGTWEGLGAEGYYIRFNADGTCQIAQVLENLASRPDIQATWRFEEDKLLIKEVSVNASSTFGLRSCGANIGTYQVQLLPNESIKFLLVSDACSGRVRSLVREHKPVR